MFLHHWPVQNTALAAALATLGVPLDPTEPYDRVIDTITGRESLQFLFAPVSSTDNTRITEHLIGFWEERAKFEAAHPDHPLVAMRAGYDARGYFLSIVHGAELPPVRNFKGEKFLSPHISEASILRAHGFPLLMFTGRAFAFPAVWQHTSARQIIEQSLDREGGSPAQWQRLFFVNLNRFLDVAKGTPVLAERDDNRTLLLSAGADKKTRDFWYDKLAE